MATFYKKTDEGEFVEADKDVDELFRQNLAILYRLS